MFPLDPALQCSFHKTNTCTSKFEISAWVAAFAHNLTTFKKRLLRWHIFRRRIGFFCLFFFKVFFAICRTGEAEMVTNTCVLIVKRMMIAMTEVMQAVKPQWHLQLLLNYHCWGWQHTSDRFIIHFAPVTSNQHPEIFFLLFFPPCSLDWFLSTLSPFSPFHISWCIICVIASVCKWRKLWWQFQFGRNSEST